MSLKDNFYAAVKDLMNKGGIVGSDLEEKAKENADLDSYLNRPAPQQETSVPTPVSAAPAEPFVETTAAEPAVANPTVQAQPAAAPVYTAQTPPPAPSAPVYATDTQPFSPTLPRNSYIPPQGDTPPAYQPMGAQDYSSSGAGLAETTIISKNTVISGNIHSFANITIQGNVKGNVEVSKAASISGKLIGDLKCSNAVMEGSAIQGNIDSKGEIIMDGDALVIGDVIAQFADVNGKIKGNLTIAGKSEFKADAVVIGNITTSSIMISDGANIDGYINTTRSSENAERYFSQEVTIE